MLTCLVSLLPPNPFFWASKLHVSDAAPSAARCAVRGALRRREETVELEAAGCGALELPGAVGFSWSGGVDTYMRRELFSCFELGS